MKIAIHQPNFIPWIGFFYKIYLADVFVFLDNVEYTKNSYINRNKIKTPTGDQWLTIPVKYSGESRSPINEIIINNKEYSLNKVLKSIQINYSKSKHFSSIFEPLKVIFTSTDHLLCNLNIPVIKLIAEKLGIKTNFILASDLLTNSEMGTQRLVNICKAINATEYISGFGGFNYQDIELFTDNKINVINYKFKHPVYYQLWGSFIPNLSALDLIMNCGEDSLNLILSNNPA